MRRRHRCRVPGERDIFAHDGDKNPFITIVSEPSLSNPGAGPV